MHPDTEKRLCTLFPREKDQATARTTLQRECGPNLECSDAELERVRIAVLKVSGGKLAALRAAVHLAKVDWRDVLVAAGFEHDEHAHERWWP